MPVYVTTSPNDADLLKALGDFALPLPIMVGDVCFTGEGSGGKTLVISCERKHAGDLAQCILTGRYQSQLQTAHTNGADVFILILEASQLRPNPDDGVLEQLNWGVNPRTLHRCQVWEAVRPTITYSRFDQYLTELQYLAGVIFKRTYDVKETAAVIKALWLNFQTPPEGHNSLHTVYHQPRQGILLVKPSLVRRVATELKGIGWEKSGAVAEHFKSVLDMVQASTQEWSKIPGIGKKIAEDIFISVRTKR